MSGLPILRLNYYNYGPRARWSLDPAHTVLAGEYQAIALVQANLVKVLPSGKPVPDLATWKLSKDKMVYTFTIRKNARFADGHPVTAQDAVFSLRRSLRAPSSGGPGALALVWLGDIQGASDYSQGKSTTLSGLKVLDQRTLRITLSRPVAYFPVLLSYPTGDILDHSEVAGRSSSDSPKANYLTNTCIANQGAGPFQPVCHDRSSSPHSFYSGSTPRFTLVPNPYYYGSRAHIKIELPRITLKLNDVTEEYKLYLANKVDASDIPPPFLMRWRGKSSQYHAYPAPLMNYLTPNVHLAPFDNVHCRLAVAYAIDRKFLAGSIADETAIPSYTVVPKGMLGYYDGRDNPQYSPQRARAELAKCPGRTIPIIYKYRKDRLDAEAIGPMLRAAGMNEKVAPISADEWVNVVGQPLDKTNTQLAWNSWVQDYPDPQDFAELLLHSGTPFNVGGWSNAKYDRLVERANFVVNRAQRAKLYIQAQHDLETLKTILDSGAGPHSS